MGGRAGAWRVVSGAVINKASCRPGHRPGQTLAVLGYIAIAIAIAIGTDIDIDMDIDIDSGEVGPVGSGSLRSGSGSSSRLCWGLAKVSLTNLAWPGLVACAVVESVIIIIGVEGIDWRAAPGADAGVTVHDHGDELAILLPGCVSLGGVHGHAGLASWRRHGG